MREILFRGKRIAGHRDNTEDGTMLYGHLFVDKKGQPKIKWYDEYFGTAMTSNVDPNTVGQFTGLVDKNGKKIFEGDIVTFPWYRWGDHIKMLIVFVDGEFRARPKEITNDEWEIRITKTNDEFEIIGNIYDNPELMN